LFKTAFQPLDSVGRVHAQPRTYALASSIKLPTLVLWGENDGVVGIGYGSTLARHIIGSIFQIVQGRRALSSNGRAQVVFDKIVAFASH